MYDEYVVSEKYIFVELNYVIVKNLFKIEYCFDNYV